MADETPVGPERGDGKHISVTRMSVGTSEVKDMHVDLLEAVNSSIGTQTERLVDLSEAERSEIKKNSVSIVDAIKNLTEINSELIAAVRSQGGGEDGGGGLSAAELKTHQRSQDIINDAADGQLKLNKIKEQLLQLYRAEVNTASATFVEGLIDGARALTSFRTVVDETRKRFSKLMDASKAGIADFPDLFLDDFRKVAMLGFGEASDSLLSTMNLIQGSLQNNLVSPMVLVGGNINEVAREFNSLRSDMDDAGLDLYRNLGFEEQNEVFMQLLDAQLRGDRMTDIRDSSVRKQMGEQIAALRLISENTGQSLDELIKSNSGSLKTLATLQATGMITAEQQKNLSAMMVNFGASAPAMEDLVTKVLEAGGNAAFFEDTEIAQSLRKAGITDIFERISALPNMKPDQATTSGLQIGQDIADALKRSGELRGGASAKIIDGGFKQLSEIATGVNAMKELDAERGKKSEVTRAFNKITDWLKNNAPIVGLVSAITAQIGFMVANTMAINANTAAHLAGALPGGVAKGGKGKFGKLKGIGKVAGSVLKKAGIIGAVATVGKDVYDLAQGDTSNENTGALTGSAIGMAIGGVIGSVIPVVGTMAGMALGATLGNFAGESIGGLIPKAPKGATPSVLGIAAPGVGAMSATGGKSTQTAMATHLISQTRLLESIATSMHTNNGLQREIRDRIGFGSSGGGTAGRDSTKKSDNIAIVPGRLGAL